MPRDQQPRVMVATPAVQAFVDQNVDVALQAAEADAADALEKYVDAVGRIAELQGIRDLRKAMGAVIESAPAAKPRLEVTGT